MELENLEKQGALQICVFLYKSGKRKVNISELQHNVEATRETILTTVQRLKEIGLIEEEVLKGWPFSHLVWLTEKGMEISSSLNTVDKLMRRAEHEQIKNAKNKL